MFANTLAYLWLPSRTKPRAARLYHTHTAWRHSARSPTSIRLGLGATPDGMFGNLLGGTPSSSPSSPPAIAPPPTEPLLLPQRVYEEAVLPFVERVGRHNFSLLEVGSWNGLS